MDSHADFARFFAASLKSAGFFCEDFFPRRKTFFKKGIPCEAMLALAVF